MVNRALGERLSAAARTMRSKFQETINIQQNEASGTEREAILANFLSKYLSPNIEIARQAEIISGDGRVSSVHDLVIIDNNAPLLQDLDTHRIIPIEYVYGVIEVKSKLTGPELKKDCEKIRKLKLLARGKSQAFGIIFGYDSIRLENLGHRFYNWCEEQESVDADPDSVWVLDKGMLSWGPVGGVSGIYSRIIASDSRELRMLSPVQDPERADVLLRLVLQLSSLIATTPLPPFRINDYIGRGVAFRITGTWRGGARSGVPQYHALQDT
jgi:hypothetical protein